MLFSLAAVMHCLSLEHNKCDRATFFWTSVPRKKLIHCKHCATWNQYILTVSLRFITVYGSSVEQMQCSAFILRQIFFLQKEWIKRENSIMLVPQTRWTLTVPAASLRLNGKDKALPLGCTFHELLPYVFHCCVYISNQTLAFYPWNADQKPHFDK